VDDQKGLRPKQNPSALRAKVLPKRNKILGLKMSKEEEADRLRKALDETKEQVRIMALQLDDYEHALRDVESGKDGSMTEYQRAVYRMFEAFIGEK